MDFLNRFNFFRQLVNNRNETMNSEYRFSNNSYTENNIQNSKNILSDLPVFRYRKIDKIKCKTSYLRGILFIIILYYCRYF